MAKREDTTRNRRKTTFVLLVTQILFLHLFFLFFEQSVIDFRGRVHGGKTRPQLSLPGLLGPGPWSCFTIGKWPTQWGSMFLAFMCTVFPSLMLFGICKGALGVKICSGAQKRFGDLC